MKHKTLVTLLFSGLAGLFNSAASAQTDVNIWAAQPILVDGNSAEWHEPLNNYNSETQLAFALANDQNNLYLIIESLDEMTTRKLLGGGLTLNINTAGKKKDGVKLLFLGMHQPSLNPDLDKAAPENNEPEPHDKTEHPAYGTEHEGKSPGITRIQVSGFKTIPNGSLTIPNTQGIQVAAAFNPQKDYICELAIPLNLLDFKGKNPGAIAYDIKINSSGFHGNRSIEGGQRPPGGGGMGGGMHGGGGGMGGGGMHGGGGGMGGGRHGGGGRPGGQGIEGSGGSAKSSDFWIKYELAKPSATFRAN